MRKRTTLLDRAEQPPHLMAHMHRWKFSVLAAAAVALIGLHTDDASALALGRITVQSALGEPLRAEIDLPQITAEEADTLRATTAASEIFRAQGMELTPAVNNLRMQLQRRADGSAVLRLSSDRPVNDPFVDLVLDASWSSGHIVRSYTMLFDPPGTRRAAPTVTAAPQISAPVAQMQGGAASNTPRAAAPAAPRTPVSSVTTSPRPPAANAAGSPRTAPASGVTVKAGDTASHLANAYRPASVSLDQMLVALMRANPDAFIQGNVNRIKAGAVLQMPDEAAAQAIPASEARQVLTAQSRDFNAFRRQLAAVAPAAAVAGAERSASGAVQARIEDKKPATTAPDKLTLSKGAMTGQKAAEDQLAKDKQASEASARMAELSKNINELNKLSAASAPVGSPAATVASAPGAMAVPAPAVAPALPTAPALPASSEPAAVAAAPEASAPVAAQAAASDSAAPEATAAPVPPPAPAPAPLPAPVQVPPREPGFLSDLMEDPLLPAGGLLAVIALGGWGLYRSIQRRRAQAGVDSSFLESRMRGDSLFGSSGGQSVDTTNSEMGSGSSMAYSPSQLDAGGDVDPVAEADVYLAYGRDLQAEEILKEATRHSPSRISVHVKLAEIYAKRQDRKALEAVAGDVFQLTRGEGPDWARVAELGSELDPENPRYQPGGHPNATDEDASPTNPDSLASTSVSAAPAATTLPPDLDFDLDLDLELPEDALSEAPASPGSFAAAAATATATATATVDGDSTKAPGDSAFGPLDLPAVPTIEAPVTAETPAIALPEMADLDFPTADELSLLPSGVMPLTGTTTKALNADTNEPDTGPVALDAAPLTLDLDMPLSMAPTANTAADNGVDAAAEDPLTTKLALAQEFHAIGDTDGARTLMEEVIAESSGVLKARAERLLADLG